MSESTDKVERFLDARKSKPNSVFRAMRRVIEERKVLTLAMSILAENHCPAVSRNADVEAAMMRAAAQLRKQGEIRCGKSNSTT